MIADEIEVPGNSTKQGDASWTLFGPGVLALEGTSIKIKHNPHGPFPYVVLWQEESVYHGLYDDLASAKKFVATLIARLLEMGQTP